MSGGQAVLPPYLPAGPSVKADDMAQMLEVIRRMTNVVVFNTATGATATVTTTAYTSVTGASTSFTKLGSATDTNILGFVWFAGFKTTATSSISVAIGDGTTDWTAVNFAYNTLSEHMSMFGIVSMTNKAAGAYTMTVRAKLSTATGTLTVNSGDTVGMTLMEVPA